MCWLILFHFTYQMNGLLLLRMHRCLYILFSMSSLCTLFFSFLLFKLEYNSYKNIILVSDVGHNNSVFVYTVKWTNVTIQSYKIFSYDKNLQDLFLATLKYATQYYWLIVTMLYTTSPWLVFYNWKCIISWFTSLILPTPLPFWQPPICSLFLSLDLLYPFILSFRFHTYVKSYSFVFFCELFHLG